MLTGDLSSLMYRILRDKLHLIYGINLFFDLDVSYMMSIFEVSCQFKNSKKLVRTFIKILEEFTLGKFDGELLKRSKERLTIMDMNNCRDSTEFLNTFYANQYMMTGNIDMTPDEYIKLINSVSKAKIIDISKRMFQFKEIVITCETK